MSRSIHLRMTQILEQVRLNLLTWPEERNFDAIAPATAASKSASSKTINGAFPPSSKDNFFNVEEDCFIKSFPTPVEPVNDTFLTIGELVIVSPTSAVFFNALMMFTTPLGTPARCASSARAKAVNGVSPGDFATTVHPAARAAPIFRVIMAAGKFHGVIRPQTPTGSFNVTTLLPAIDAGIVSPYTRGASSLNHSKKLAAYEASPLASAKGFPFSQVMSFAISSEFSTCFQLAFILSRRSLFSHTIKSYHFRRSLERCRPVCVLKEGKAAAAASIAFCVSAASNSGADPINFPEEGSARHQLAILVTELTNTTSHLKCLPRCCFHPLAVYVCNVELQQ